MKNVLFWPYKYNDMLEDWRFPVYQMISAFAHYGYNILRHENFKCRDIEHASIYDFNKYRDDIDICIYNHTDISWITGNVVKSRKNLFFKPTVPEQGYTTIDELGYGPFSSVYYNKPDFEVFTENDINLFYSTDVDRWIKLRSNKWNDSFSPEKTEINEEDYYLVLGQCYGDEVVNRHDFGSYKNKIESIVAELTRVDSKRKIIVKLHPYTNGADQPMHGGFVEVIKNEIGRIGKNVIVYTGNLSIHDFLPKARCVLIANSGAGFEAMMHNKPIISWGNPEYHWITYKLVHLADMIRAINIENWFNEFKQKQFLYWYTKFYCFNDTKSCIRRVGELI